MTYTPNPPDRGPLDRPAAGSWQAFSPDLFSPTDGSYNIANATATNLAATWKHNQVMGASGYGTPLGAGSGAVRYPWCRHSRRSALAQLSHEAMNLIPVIDGSVGALQVLASQRGRKR